MKSDADRVIEDVRPLPRMRFTVRRLMIVVAIVALDAFCVRTFLGYYPQRAVNLDTIVVVGLPMANALAIATLAGLRRPASRPFIVGFVAFGALAMASQIAWVVLSNDSYARFWTPYLKPISAALRRLSMLARWPLFWTFVLYAAHMILLMIPQLLLAGIGGWATNRLGRKSMAARFIARDRVASR